MRATSSRKLTAPTANFPTSIQNIAIINQLHKGRRERYVRLIDHYFAAGMERLIENKAKVEPVYAQLLEVLDDAVGKQAVAELVKQWAGLSKFQIRYEQYRQKYADEEAVDQKNKAQHQMREVFDPLFVALHDGLKQLDKTVRQHEKHQAEQAQADGKRAGFDRKTNALKTALGELHGDVKDAEMFFKHIRWLQERFPKAEYEDVIGLCKLATPAELKEQEYSLNPGRYVGVVIEEDGKTEEEFMLEILSLKDQVELLGKSARDLETVVSNNVKILAGEK
jgi:type I restriction enzyme M protein